MLSYFLLMSPNVCLLHIFLFIHVFLGYLLAIYLIGLFDWIICLDYLFGLFVGMDRFQYRRIEANREKRRNQETRRGRPVSPDGPQVRAPIHYTPTQSYITRRYVHPYIIQPTTHSWSFSPL